MPTLARPTGTALALLAALVASSCTAMRANGPSLSTVRQDLDRVALVPSVESLDAEPPRPTATGPLRIAILPPSPSSRAGTEFRRRPSTAGTLTS